MKLVTVFFDLEAPFLWKPANKFDLEGTVRNISEVLNQFGVKAVFNTCGILAEKFPRLIAMLHDEGHEIASHGYAHENFLKVSVSELDGLLARTERILQDIIGTRPKGVRAPRLAANETVYNVFRKRNYSWASNQYVPFWTTKSRVDLGDASYLKWLVGKTVYSLKQFSQREDPFRDNLLVEIPLLSPMDVYCIFPFPQPEMNSPQSYLEEAYNILVAHYSKCKKHFNLNFHEHAIGTANRIRLLERIICFLSEQPEASFVLPNRLVTSFC